MNSEDNLDIRIKIITPLYIRLIKWIFLLIFLILIYFSVILIITHKNSKLNFIYSLFLIMVVSFLILYMTSILLLKKEIKAEYLFTSDRIIKTSYKGIFFRKFYKSELYFNEINFILYKSPKEISIFKKFGNSKNRYKGDEKEKIYYLHDNAVYYRINFKKLSSGISFNELLNFLIEKCKLIKHPYLVELYFSN